MKTILRKGALTLAFAIIAGLGLLAFVRLAPSDPAVWHISLVTAAEAGQGPCLSLIAPQRNGARVACMMAGPPDGVLARLDQAARASPRTTLLAGTPQSGRITWITRTALIGYPDYTTAEASQTAIGTRLDIYARQRFGNGDWGVNAARLREWLKDL